MTDLLLRFLTLDEDFSARLAVSRASPWRLPLLLLAHSGDGPLWLLLAAVALLVGDDRWNAIGWQILVGTLTSGLVTTVLKWLFRRRRPPGESRGFYTRFDRHAFPSGHAGRSICLAVLILPSIPPPLAALPFLWVGLVGWARVALRVHFISDILGGWLVGAVVGIGCRIAL